MSKAKFQEKYEKWWLNKKCRLAHQRNRDFKLVVKIKLFGPPSYFYGGASLVYDDGTDEVIQNWGSKPIKSDVEIEENH